MRDAKIAFPDMSRFRMSETIMPRRESVIPELRCRKNFGTCHSVEEVGRRETAFWSGIFLRHRYESDGLRRSLAGGWPFYHALSYRR